MKVFNNMKMYTSYLESLYKHIFANTPIYSWGYFYYDLNGRCLQLMSDNSLLDVFLKKELFTDQIINSLQRESDFYASDVMNDGMLADSLKETLVEQRYVYFFDMVHEHADYTEIYTFASTSSAQKSNNFILNNIDILKVISQDLATRGRRLLTKDNTLILPNDFNIEMNALAESYEPDHSLNLKKIILGQKENSPKLHEMVNDTVFDFNTLPFNFMSARQLTLKEKEIIYLYYYGFNVQRIANILEVSKRTVDKHLENIKKKLDCDSTGQIIPTLLRSNISINQFIQKA
ncbi:MULTISPECIES: helix-turn-helix transcriptional regulator [Legionella]|uniref:LuxR family transcriptional regulator n=1 Tax=Legionella steelei TaxID=947033 RepID=A0A0W0ZDM9_9GAMM|nr:MULTISPECIES: helix-turn-helix transcriptional regulator [Legionella]KTD67216.1 LuxR family transcriptional regulator [Legionella steelei]MBN9228245.1 transcriptional regulator [Legionella steelei]OJW09492.1 MAG: helix-turn-helix transcriptional regulator [Legionella sp. 39-23]